MILMTRNLIMRPHKIEEAHIFAEWLNDPEVVKFSEQRHKKHTVLSQRDYWMSKATTEPDIYYVIDYATNNRPIGSISATIDLNNQIANVGIIIGDKSVWGNGYGYEAWECFCNYLFIEKKIRKVEAGSMSSNKSMRRICERFFMQLEGTQRGHFLIDAMPSDLVMYGKFAG